LLAATSLLAERQGSFTVLAHDLRLTEMEACLMVPVANDFAAIAQRLKEIQAEVAKERLAAAEDNADTLHAATADVEQGGRFAT
jgi:hypothetical protein